MMAKFPRSEDISLIEQYLASELDVAGVAALEDRLKSNPELLAFFVEYSSMDLAIRKTVRNQESLSKSINPLFPQSDASNSAFDISRQFSGIWRFTFTAALLFALCGIGWWFGASQSSSVAWVQNAQECLWDQNAAYRGRFVRGQVLQVQEGVLELGFASQASVLVEGPASLKIISDSSIELRDGSIAVKMPKGFSGFEVLTPNGRVLDLGTEFGVSVIDGNVNLAVFDGEVVAVSAAEETKLVLRQDESATIGLDQIQRNVVAPDFVREISKTKRVPETISYDFGSEVGASNGIKDSLGKEIGLTRFEGTGRDLLEWDENLRLDLEKGVLRIQATKSDINHQFELGIGEYFGRSLSELGFTGSEDFEVSMRVVDVPELIGKGVYAQYGLYVAKNLKTSIRGGVILWPKPDDNRQFLVNNMEGVDRDGNRLGYISPGSNIEIMLRRMDGKFSLEIKDLGSENSNTLRIKHLDFLDSSSDFQVGVFVANPFFEKAATIQVDHFQVTVWHDK